MPQNNNCQVVATALACLRTPECDCPLFHSRRQMKEQQQNGLTGLVGVGGSSQSSHPGAWCGGSSQKLARSCSKKMNTGNIVTSSWPAGPIINQAIGEVAGGKVSITGDGKGRRSKRFPHNENNQENCHFVTPLDHEGSKAPCRLASRQILQPNTSTNVLVTSTTGKSGAASFQNDIIGPASTKIADENFMIVGSVSVHEDLQQISATMLDSGPLSNNYYSKTNASVSEMNAFHRYAFTAPPMALVKKDPSTHAPRNIYSLDDDENISQLTEIIVYDSDDEAKMHRKFLEKLVSESAFIGGAVNNIEMENLENRGNLEENEVHMEENEPRVETQIEETGCPEEQLHKQNESATDEGEIKQGDGPLPMLQPSIPASIDVTVGFHSNGEDESMEIARKTKLMRQWKSRCPVCEQKSYGNLPIFRRHMATHTGFKYTCSGCNRRFRHVTAIGYNSLTKGKFEDLTSHQTQCEGFKKNMNGPDKNNPIKLIPHISGNTMCTLSPSTDNNTFSPSESEIQCFFCAKYFQFRDQLKTHLMFDHDERPKGGGRKKKIYLEHLPASHGATNEESQSSANQMENLQDSGGRTKSLASADHAIKQVLQPKRRNQRKKVSCKRGAIAGTICLLCEYSTSGMNFHFHMASHTGFKYSCLGCKRRFRHYRLISRRYSGISTLRTHQMECTEFKKLKLDNAKSQFTCKAHTDRPYVVHNCASIARNLAAPDDTGFQCYFCNKVFHLRVHLKLHLMNDHDERPKLARRGNKV